MPLNPKLGAHRAGEISYSPLFCYIHLLFDLAALVMAWRITLEGRPLLNAYLPIAIPREVMPVLAFRLGALLALWLLASLWLKTYQDRGDHSIVAALFRVMESTLVVTTLAVVVTFFSRQLGIELSRSFVLLFAPVSLICLIGSLALAIFLSNQVERQWAAPKQVAVLGDGANIQEVAEAINRASGKGIAFRGLILPDRPESGTIPSTTFPILGTARQLAELINRECLDRIIVAPGSVTESEFEYYSELMKRMGVTISRPILWAESGVLVKHRVQYGMHLIDLASAPTSSWEDGMKRSMDAIAALVLITLLLPLFCPACLSCTIHFQRSDLLSVKTCRQRWPLFHVLEVSFHVR